MKHLKKVDSKQIFIKAHGSKFWKPIHSDRAIGNHVKNIQREKNQCAHKKETKHESSEVEAPIFDFSMY